MTPAIYYAFGALGVIVAAWVTGRWAFKSARQQHSGTVVTADATTIFSAAEQLRQELRDDLVHTRDALKKRDEEIETLQKRADDCESREKSLRRRIIRLEEVHKAAGKALEADEIDDDEEDLDDG